MEVWRGHGGQSPPPLIHTQGRFWLVPPEVHLSPGALPLQCDTCCKSLWAQLPRLHCQSVLVSVFLNFNQMMQQRRKSWAVCNNETSCILYLECILIVDNNDLCCLTTMMYVCVFSSAEEQHKYFCDFFFKEHAERNTCGNGPLVMSQRARPPGSFCPPTGGTNHWV